MDISHAPGLNKSADSKVDGADDGFVSFLQRLEVAPTTPCANHEELKLILRGVSRQDHRALLLNLLNLSSRGPWRVLSKMFQCPALHIDQFYLMLSLVHFRGHH